MPFPGERAACYSADLLLRQYKRIRDEKKKKFSYKDIKPVYTIVLFECSPVEFHQFPDTYLHYVEPKSDSGISLNLIQKYLFIPLDIFQKIYHNKDITSNADAWLAFLCMDGAEDVIRLITAYPRFKPLYEEIYRLCLNTEKIMGLFSKELQILDENTVQYMMDEMQETINKQQGTIDEQQGTINEMQGQLGEKEDIIEEKDAMIAEKNADIQALQKRIKDLEEEREYSV